MKTKSEMVPNGKGFFHNGHYREYFPWPSLKRIKNPYYDETLLTKDGDEIWDYFANAYVLLDGACYTFAYALHQKLGYEVFELNMESSLHLHAFCKSIYQGQEVYIDVRGATTSLEEFFDSLAFTVTEDYIIEPHDDFEQDGIFGGDAEEMLYKFASMLVDEYEGYYKF